MYFREMNSYLSLRSQTLHVLLYSYFQGSHDLLLGSFSCKKDWSCKNWYNLNPPRSNVDPHMRLSPLWSVKDLKKTYLSNLPWSGADCIWGQGITMPSNRPHFAIISPLWEQSGFMFRSASVEYRVNFKHQSRWNLLSLWHSFRKHIKKAKGSFIWMPEDYLKQTSRCHFSPFFGCDHVVV